MFAYDTSDDFGETSDTQFGKQTQWDEKTYELIDFEKWLIDWKPYIYEPDWIAETTKLLVTFLTFGLHLMFFFLLVVEMEVYIKVSLIKMMIWRFVFSSVQDYLFVWHFLFMLIQHVQVPVPSPKSNEVLLKLEATSLNPVDWKIQKGMIRPFLPRKFPCIPGKF